MKNLLTKLRYVPKRFGLVAAIMVAGATAAMTFAWGPSRTTFTVENPAPYVTFNSITNNPVDGDERNFSRAKDTTATAPSAWTDSVAVTPGKEYVVRMVVHNNAADNLNLKAINTRASAAVPTTTGKSVTVSNYVSADNANPGKVWDDVTFTGTQDFNLAYVAGSARIYNNGYAAGGGGQPLPDSIVTSAGAVLGYEKAGDGIIPGCFKYLSYVEYKVKPQFAPTTEFEVAKTVRKSGTTTWGETAAVAPGDTVQYRIKYSNTSTVQQNDVVVRDTLPAGVSYVTGTTKLYNNLFPNGKAMSDNITGAGINIGHHSGGSASFVVFDAKVAANDTLAVCGPNTLKNIAKVETDYGTKQDDADVTVTKTCVVKDIQVCELATKKIITIKENVFDATKHSKNLDDCKVIVKDIQVCLLSNKTIITIKETDFDATKHSKNLDDCKVIVKDIQVCELSTKKIITIKEDAFDATKHSKNLDDCKAVEVKEIKVCRLSDKTIITIKETDFDATKHSKNLEDCKPVEVKNIDVCELATKQIITIKETEFDATMHSKNLNDCKTLEAKFIKVCVLAEKTITTINEKDFDATKHSKDLDVCKEVTPPVTPPVTPETPETLPSTGPATLLSGLFGSSALGLGISSFVRSRAALRSSMNR